MNEIPKPSGNVINYYSDNTARVITNVTGYWKSLFIVNDGASNLTFIVNNLSITVRPNEQFDDDFEDFNNIEIVTNNISYRLGLRG